MKKSLILLTVILAFYVQNSLGQDNEKFEFMTMVVESDNYRHSPYFVSVSTSDTVIFKELNRKKTKESVDRKGTKILVTNKSEYIEAMKLLEEYNSQGWILINVTTSEITKGSPSTYWFRNIIYFMKRRKK